MTVGEFPVPRRDRGSFENNDRGSFESNDVSRTSLAISQMLMDGVALIVLSYVSLSVAMFLGKHAKNYVEYVFYLIPTIAATIVMVCMFARSGVYNPLNLRDQIGILRSTVKCLIQTMLLLVGCLFIVKMSDDFSRIWLAAWTGTSAVALCGFRLVAARAAERLIRGGRLSKNIAVIGANEVGQQLAVKLVKESLGTRLVGLFDERLSRTVGARAGPVVRQLSVLDELLCAGRVDEVVIAIPPSASVRIWELSRRYHPFPVSLRILAPAGYEQFQVLDSSRYGNIGTFRVMGKPLDEVAAVLKRLEDVVIALLGVLITLPLMLFIAVAIKLDSPGPVFFRQKRLGAHNLPFDLLKFRSMYIERADPLGTQLTRAGDPRVTRVGRLLRRTSMDELPQLFNVLRGEMSLVGPRPHALAANAAGITYARAISEYPIRHRVKPGITGWAQVNGWRGETTTIEQIRRRVEHDLYYIENWSLTFDLLILGRTVFTVLSRENAV
jgi:Undecaprenyl-phosphate glucose phosphotransferase